MSTATEVNPHLLALVQAGVSPWLDQIRRTLVEGGELRRMVREESLRGVTSNPSIFEKAILGSTDYDEDLKTFAQQNLDAQAIYERLAIRDVQLAADVLSDVHREADGRDGFVSLEVAPDLARDRERTIEAARTFWRAVDRPNVMIKIPGTPEGASAIERAIYEGINVNVTLLFSVAAYEAVAEAYLRGLERRLAEGKTLDVNSVASFFVSRVDTKADRILEALGRSDLAGTAAVANARLAYRRFKEIFDGPRWEALRHAGAAVQRPLWASTGAKNPNYSDTKYVDELVGAHTVNTMPLATLLAVADHGKVTGPTAEHDPDPALRALADAGLNLKQVTDELLVEGVKQFEDAMVQLLAGIEERRAAVLTGQPPTINARIPSELQGPIAERVKQAVAERVAERIWRRDASLWGGPGVPEIEDRLGWLTVSETMLEHAPDLGAFAEQCRADGFTDCVLLGMGGSSLGPEVIRRSFGEIPGEAKDNTARVLDAGSVPDLAVAGDDALRSLLGDAKPPHYVAIMGYLPSSDALDAAVAALRETIRAAAGVATTFGYGPRCLHSTGQLHKGGPPIGRFLQLVDEPSRDAEIPGAGYSFRTLIAAQAAGDLETLRSGLPAERVKLDGEPAAAVRAFSERIRGILSVS